MLSSSVDRLLWNRFLFWLLCLLFYINAVSKCQNSSNMSHYLTLSTTRRISRQIGYWCEEIAKGQIYCERAMRIRPIKEGGGARPPADTGLARDMVVTIYNILGLCDWVCYCNTPLSTLQIKCLNLLSMIAF